MYVDKNGNEVILDDEAVEKILSYNGVLTATPFYYPQFLSGMLHAGGNGRYTLSLGNVVGVYPEALPLLGFELIQGSWEEAFSAPYSIVSGQYTAYNLRDSRKKRGSNRIDAYKDADGNMPDPFVDLTDTTRP